jgi:hypothetical protein
MKVFKTDIAQSAGELKARGYVLLRDVLTPEFLSYLKDFLSQAQTGQIAEQGEWRIAGKKQQYVFAFPDDEAAEEFRCALSLLTGLERDRLTISERHLKQYAGDANPYPAPHKDRGASRFSVGLPIHLGPETSVCVFPSLDRSDNLGDRAVFMTPADRDDGANIYNSREAVFLNERIGDMIVFHGSSMFHERVRPAGTAVLYIKINDDGRDPLGENIYGSWSPRKAEAALAGHY